MFINKFPVEIWLEIVKHMEPEDLVSLEKTSKQLWNHFEAVWKDKCEREFPWFFWLGHCERKQELKLNTTCKTCKVPGDSPYHPLLELEEKDIMFKKAYLRIYFGRYTGMLQVLNCGPSREMSAFTSLATFDRGTNSMIFSIDIKKIARYRHGEMINLKGNETTSFPISQRHRFRRIPLFLLTEDPRVFHTSSMFDYPLTSDGRPAFVEGDEIEVQWRSNRLSPYSWWKGVVLSSYLNPDLTFTTDSKIVVPNQQFHPEVEEGIAVVFPHYPPESPWSSLVVSMLGIENRTDQLGYIGGIKDIECQVHTLIWDYWFPISAATVRGQQIPL